MKFNLWSFWFPILAGAMMSNSIPTASADEPLVFISAFAAGDKGGIHAFQLEMKSGQLKPVHRTTGVEHPFFLALSPDRKFLYSIHAKTFGGKENEQIAAYSIAGRTGELQIAGIECLCVSTWYDEAREQILQVENVPATSNGEIGDHVAVRCAVIYRIVVESVAAEHRQPTSDRVKG